MINSRDISVIIQGPIHDCITGKCADSIRVHLPCAEIILSTWEGERVEGIAYDKCVFSQDPGMITLDENQFGNNNINRQLVSTMNGIRQASKRYVVKIRSDFLLTSSNFVQLYEKYNRVESDYTVFDHPVITCHYFSRNPRITNALYAVFFHPSDIFLFGMKEDIERLFKTELDSSGRTLNHFEKKYIYVGNKTLFPEQYLFLKLLEKKGILAEKQDENQYELNERLFAYNYIILENHMIGLKCLKKGMYKYIPMHNCYSYFDWLALRKKYCSEEKLWYQFYKMKCWGCNFYYFIRKMFDDVRRGKDV